MEIRKLFRGKPRVIRYGGRRPIIYTNGKYQATASEIRFKKHRLEVVFVVYIDRAIVIEKATVKFCEWTYRETLDKPIHCIAGNQIEFIHDIKLEGD